MKIDDQENQIEILERENSKLNSQLLSNRIDETLKYANDFIANSVNGTSKIIFFLINYSLTSLFSFGYH